jgi:pimeloyl-ACP methyl ester carboxylesterase
MAAFFTLGNATCGAATTAVPETTPLKKIQVNGVELHYLDQGSGVPVVFIHGGLVDYRRWTLQVEPFARHYRVITYSRRYNFPNQNPRIDPAYSAAIDAEDLAALIKGLRLGQVNVVGESHGAYTALYLAVRHPELVNKLVLAEAPMLRWLNSSPEGKAAFDEYQDRLWHPVGQAFSRGDSAAAMKVIAAFFLDGATVASMPPDLRALVEANLREWQALSTSSDAFPSLRRDEVAGIRAPTLLMGGAQTLTLHKLLDAQYAALLPHSTRVVIPNATHEMWDEQPALCREKTLEFLAR